MRKFLQSRSEASGMELFFIWDGVGALRIVYNNRQCNFEELPERNYSLTIYERNLQKLAIEMFKVNNCLSVQLVSGN